MNTNTDSPIIRETDGHALARRQLHREAAALLRDLEAAADSGAEGMDLAGKFVGVVAAHIGPLRSAVNDVEFYDKAERIISGLRVRGDRQ